MDLLPPNNRCARAAPYVFVKQRQNGNKIEFDKKNMKKHLANIITCLRIIGSNALKNGNVLDMKMYSKLKTEL